MENEMGERGEGMAADGLPTSEKDGRVYVQGNK